MIDQECRELMLRGLDELALRLDPEQLERLCRYVGEIELWNPRLKLVAANGPDLVRRHVLDSLAGAVALERHLGVFPARIADVGSGAGLPGIPIAIAFPGTHVDLVERSGRRVGFLRNAVAVTRCPAVEIHPVDASDYEGPAEASVHRAFIPLTSEVYEMLARPVEGGRVVAFKGRRSVIDSEIDALLAERRVRGDESELRIDVLPLRVPFLDEERHLVILSR